MWEIITSSPQGLRRVTMLPNLLTANRGARWSLFLGALYPICCLSASSASTTKHQGRLLSLSMEPGGPQERAYGTSHSWKPPALGAAQSSVQIRHHLPLFLSLRPFQSVDVRAESLTWYVKGRPTPSWGCPRSDKHLKFAETGQKDLMNQGSHADFKNSVSAKPISSQIANKGCAGSSVSMTCSLSVIRNMGSNNLVAKTLDADKHWSQHGFIVQHICRHIL